MVATYITWRNDRVLYGSYPLDVDVGLCINCICTIVLLEVKHEQRNMVGLFEY